MIRFLTMIAVLASVLVASGSQTGEPKDLKDPKNWTPIKITGNQKAPEFEDIAEWINSDALTMKDLQGKILVVHFMAFG